MLRDGRLSKNGKTYSTLGFAKSSITNKAHLYKDYYKNYLTYDFIIFKDNGSIEIIPVKEHIFDVFTRRLNRVIELKKSYESRGYNTSMEDKSIKSYSNALKELKEV